MKTYRVAVTFVILLGIALCIQETAADPAGYHVNDLDQPKKTGAGNLHESIALLKSIRNGTSSLTVNEQKQVLLETLKKIDEKIDIQDKAMEHRLMEISDPRAIRHIADRALSAISKLRRMNARKDSKHTEFSMESPSLISDERLLGRYRLADGIDGIAVDSNYAYVAARREGFIILDISNPEKVDKISQLKLDFVNDVAVRGNHVFIAGGQRRFADGHFSIVDVSEKKKPLLLAKVDLPRGANRIHANDSYVFVSAHGAGLFIYDCTSPRSPKLMSNFRVAYDPSEYPEVAKSLLLENHTWGVITEGDIAYVCDDHAGVRLVDISDIQNPKQISRYMHKKGLGGFCNDVVIDKDFMYLAYDFGFLVIVDISDKMHPKMAGEFNPNGSKGWKESDMLAIRLAKVENYVYISTSRKGGITVIDVGKPQDPRQVYFYKGNASVWGLAIFNGKVYGGAIPIEGHRWGGMEIFSSFSRGHEKEPFPD
ncbi:MAG: hypothetical protein SV775_01215 [Thermodesulfobacteriota bacterium]|nr:hypothetical protein [Thermodesulfobacteriota bacterium]